jgi:hypothetical protein
VHPAAGRPDPLDDRRLDCLVDVLAGRERAVACRLDVGERREDGRRVLSPTMSCSVSITTCARSTARSAAKMRSSVDSDERNSRAGPPVNRSRRTTLSPDAGPVLP